MRLRLDVLSQAEATRLVALLRLAPYSDGATRFQFVSEVAILTVYDDGEWVIVYRVWN